MPDGLLPCPWCGLADAISLVNVGDGEVGLACHRCEAIGPTRATDADTLRAAWNRRSTTEPAVPEGVVREALEFYASRENRDADGAYGTAYTWGGLKGWRFDNGKKAAQALAALDGSGPGSDLDAFQQEVGEWAAVTFPREGIESVVAHLREEAEELVRAATGETASEEAADVLLPLLQVGYRREFSLMDAARAKFERIRHQQWEWREDLGYYKRVKDAGEIGFRDAAQVEAETPPPLAAGAGWVRL